MYASVWTISIHSTTVFAGVFSPVWYYYYVRVELPCTVRATNSRPSPGIEVDFLGLESLGSEGAVDAVACFLLQTARGLSVQCVWMVVTAHALV